MSERAKYSRVYWSVIDDPKFAGVYDHDAHLAAWLRCLLAADQSHPASAHIPAGCKRASIRTLSAAGLIDVDGNRYRVHGLDAERTKRAALAAHSGPGRDPDGTRTGGKRDPDGSLGLGRGLDRETEQGLNGENSARPDLRPVESLG